MRLPSVLIVGCVLTSGCFSNYDAYGIDTACVEVPWFVDADGDGWGEPIAAEEGQMACDPPDDQQAWVRNNRDCDDADAPSVTGRIGSLCPSELVTYDGSGEATDFSPRIQGEEFVIVHEDTTTVWPGAARDACGPYGWGGQLATFDTDSQLETVLAEAADLGGWAGWVGFRPTDETWGSFALDGTWVIDDSASASVTYCDNSRVDDDDECDPSDAEQPEGDYDCHAVLALVLDDGEAADDWCLGTPDEAGLATAAQAPDYQRQYGHFICERPSPDPSQYAVCPPGASCGDTGQ